MNADIFSPRNVFKACIDCCKRKRGTVNAQMFERKLCSNIVSLTKSLQKGDYLPGKSICFVVRNPKPREAFAADFKDRVVHHLVVRFLEQHWEKVFIGDSYACRKGKGTLAAVERLHHNMRSTLGTERSGLISCSWISKTFSCPSTGRSCDGRQL